MATQTPISLFGKTLIELIFQLMRDLGVITAKTVLVFATICSLLLFLAMDEQHGQLVLISLINS